MLENDAILVTGGSGLVGVNLVSYLKEAGFKTIHAPNSTECDLTNREAVLDYFKQQAPAYVFHMAGFVRGLMGNMKNQGQAYLNNILINTHVVDACQKYGVKKIVAMGTVAMYSDPKPNTVTSEDDIWNGPPHFSEYGYAQAKRGMLAQLQAYEDSYKMPYAFALSTNLYGPHDRFNTETGHVIPSLVKKFHAAKLAQKDVTVWGDGSPKRDFLYIKDAVRGLHTIMDHVTGTVNLVTGQSQTIKDAVSFLAAHTQMEDRVTWDKSKPNGQLHRAYDGSRLKKAGFECKYTLQQGLAETYNWYIQHADIARC